jgi:hypothetical protein
VRRRRRGKAPEFERGDAMEWFEKSIVVFRNELRRCGELKRRAAVTYSSARATRAVCRPAGALLLAGAFALLVIGPILFIFDFTL